MSVKIDIKGLDPSKFENITQIFDEELTKTLADVGGDWLADTKANTPVDTGNLRDSWALSDIGKKGRNIEVEISNNIEYAPHVEYGHRTRNGTSYVNGVYMLKKATIEAEERLPSDLEDAKRRIEARLS